MHVLMSGSENGLIKQTQDICIGVAYIIEQVVSGGEAKERWN